MKTINNASPPENVDGQTTSGDNLSFWFESLDKPLNYEKLGSDLDTDVLVIGGGISGLTTAYCLALEGLDVVLVEDGNIGSGETGRTTAHLTSALSERYAELEKTFDQETNKLVAQSHTAAIEWIANTIQQNNIECNFKKVDGYLFPHPSDSADMLQEEYQATQRAGLLTELLDNVPGIATVHATECIRYPDQAQFHILQYMKGLADAFVRLGGKIYTQTKAENISKDGADANGFKITAKHIVVATNTPINDWVSMHTKQWPYRTYVIAARVPKGRLPYSLWWDTGDQDSKWITKPYHYARLEAFNDTYDMLIAGGEDHRTGQTEDEKIKEADRYAILENWTRKHFPAMEDIAYKWSGQIMEPIDSIAFIGKNPGDDNIYIITGHSGNGMTHGTLGGMIIGDIIAGRENPWIKIYSPSRITLKTTREYLHEMGNMMAQYADWVTPEDVKHTDELKKGEGAIITSGMKKIAVYRDEANQLHTCTAVCPHLGGILQWNADEKSFDCPMHGSRFTAEGKVINGPASSDLKKIVNEKAQSV